MCSTRLSNFIEGLGAGLTQNCRPDSQAPLDDSYDFEDETSTMLPGNSTALRDTFIDFFGYSGGEDVLYEEFSISTSNTLVYCDNDNVSDHSFPPKLAWRRYRPSLQKWICVCFKTMFCIFVLSAFVIGGATVLIMFLHINTADVCSGIKWNDIPKSVQRVRVIVQTCEGWLLQFLHIFTMLCIFGWQSIVGELQLMNWNLCAAFTDSLFRLYLQVYDLYDLSWISVVLNLIFIGMMFFNSYRIAKYFRDTSPQILLLTFQLSFQFIVGLATIYLTINIVIPWFIYSNPFQQVLVATVAPIIAVISKDISRIAIENITHINHPGSSYLLIIVSYASAAVIYRTLQAQVESVYYFALLCIILGFIGLIERLTLVARDHFYIWFYKKVLKRESILSHIGAFRTPRTQRLVGDITICSAIQEVTALILTNAFVQLYKLQFGVTKNGTYFKIGNVFRQFVLRVLISIFSEYVFSTFAFFVLTWYFNIALVQIWKRKCKRFLLVNLFFCCFFAFYCIHHLVDVVNNKYKNKLYMNKTIECVPSDLLFFK